MWFRIIKAEYLSGCSFFSSKIKGGSQFQQGLHKVNHLVKWGVVFKIGDGLNCKLWQDCWLHEVSLKISYEELYKMTRDPECSVSNCQEEEDQYIGFRRSLYVAEFDRWKALHEELTNVVLTLSSHDAVLWALEKNKHFTIGF